jgi:hypothetical protein
MSSHIYILPTETKIKFVRQCLRTTNTKFHLYLSSNIAGPAEVDKHGATTIYNVLPAIGKFNSSFSATATSRYVRPEYPGWTASKGTLFHNPYMESDFTVNAET